MHGGETLIGTDANECVGQARQCLTTFRRNSKIAGSTFEKAHTVHRTPRTAVVRHSVPDLLQMRDYLMPSKMAFNFSMSLTNSNSFGSTASTVPRPREKCGPQRLTGASRNVRIENEFARRSLV
jgi:hypothetical protein